MVNSYPLAGLVGRDTFWEAMSILKKSRAAQLMPFPKFLWHKNKVVVIHGTVGHAI